MFGYGGMLPPWMQAAGAIGEDGAVGAPPFGVPGGGIGGDLPEVRAFNSARDPKGLMSPRGGVGAPSMPMGDVPPSEPFNGSASIRGALADNAMKPQKPSQVGGGMFGRKPDWKQALAAGLAAWSAARGSPVGQAALQHMLRMREAQQEAQIRASMPQQVGQSIGRVDPVTGQWENIYRDPSTPEAYALGRGFTPGTPEYQAEVQNYRLGAWSPEAVGAKVGLEGIKTDNRLIVQDDQQTWRDGNREDWQRHGVSMQDDRQADARDRPAKPRAAPAPKQPQSEGALYADIMRRWTQGQTPNGREREFVRSYEARNKGKGRGGSSRPSASSQEAVARGPDGREYVVRNGQWVPR